MINSLKLTLVLLLLTFSSNLFACGKVSWAIDAINGEGPMTHYSKDELFKSLAKVGGACQQLANENPYENQEKLVTLLLNPNLANYLNTYGSQIFLGFDCLNYQKKHKRYSELTSRYASNQCPEHQISHIDSVNGINLRDKPVVADNKLTVLPQGAKVKILATEGDWVKVEVLQYNPYFTPPCRFKSPCVVGYLYKSAM